MLGENPIPQEYAFDFDVIQNLLEHFKSVRADGRIASGGGYLHKPSFPHDFRMIITDMNAIRSNMPLYGVGFFGQLRPDVTIRAYMDLIGFDRILVESLDPRLIIGYANIPIGDGNNGNVVLPISRGMADEWMMRPEHRYVVEHVAPEVFSRIFLHNFDLPEGILGRLVYQRTRVYDFSHLQPDQIPTT